MNTQVEQLKLMYKSKLKRGICILTVTVLALLLGGTNAQATSTGQKLRQAESQKAKAESNLDKTNDSLDKLHNERASLQTCLDEINAKLEKANQKLNEIESIKEKKEADIKQAGEDIEEAKQLQVERRKQMETRIRYFYEQGETSYLKMFFEASSFADLLNKADYVEQVNEYDRDMLKKYQETEIEITEKQKQMKEDEKTLTMLKQQADADSEEVYNMLKDSAKKMTEFRDQIAEQEEKALEYEKQMLSAQTDVEELKKQYQEELSLSMQSATMVSRDLSNVTFSAEDLDLMAAIIECEAGGEPYTGKVAVGAVVLNRVRSPLFPSTVLEVLMQSRQFSPVGSGRFTIVLARGANESCYQAASDAMAGASPVGNCLFFRTPIPGLTGQFIGGHVFY